jgi:hypothetical protein
VDAGEGGQVPGLEAVEIDLGDGIDAEEATEDLSSLPILRRYLPRPRHCAKCAGSRGSSHSQRTTVGEAGSEGGEAPEPEDARPGACVEAAADLRRARSRVGANPMDSDSVTFLCKVTL